MRRNREAGQSLLLVAAAVVVLMGFAGLSLDMGMVRHEKRLQQTAADAAAIAGADNLAHPASGGITAGAQDASARDGYTDNGGGMVSACGSSAAVGTICVQVNHPPSWLATDPHLGDPNYVEVLVAAVEPTYFMKVLGINQETVMARAEATNVSGGINGPGCAWTLGSPSGQIEGINVTGKSHLNAVNCGIIDNGNFNTKGNALDVQAGTFGTAGDWSANGTKAGDVTCSSQAGPCPAVGMPASSDPFAGLPTPCTQGYTCTGGGAISISGTGSCGTGCSYNSSTGLYTVSPGTYSSITITGVGTSPGVVFQPGMYIFDGSGFNETGNATVTGNGVTFYFTGNSTMSIGGTPNISLTAPSTGTYAGILMYQDPTDTNVGPAPNGPTLGGNSGSAFNGVLYFPSDQVTFSGNANSNICGAGVGGINAAMLVSTSIALSGNPTVCLDGPAGLPTGTQSILTQAVLVE